MKLTIKTNPRMIVEVEGETQKDLFQAAASASEVFGEEKCGMCGSDKIVPAYRTVSQGKKVFEYPEWHCTNPQCRARLSLGCNMEGGTLFPHRKLDEKGKPDRENGKWDNKHRGWTKYKGEPQSQQEEK